MRARHGFSLFEVIIAGAILVLVVTAVFRGIVVATNVSHHNARILAAEAHAWEKAWLWLNKNYETLPQNETKTITLTSEECPAISREAMGSPATCVIRVTECKDATAVVRHGDRFESKLIEVNVIWGNTGNRRALNSLGAGDASNSGIPIAVYKSSINRNYK